MTLKISILNQLKMQSDLIFISSMLFIFLFFFYDLLEFNLIIWLFIPFILIYIFPVLFLHLNYLKENKGIIFELNKNEILKKTATSTLKYSNKNINEINFYMHGLKDSSHGILPYERHYYYAKVKLLDGSFFIITSLYSSKIDTLLEENLKDVRITKEKVFYPMIKL